MCGRGKGGLKGGGGVKGFIRSSSQRGTLFREKHGFSRKGAPRGGKIWRGCLGLWDSGKIAVRESKIGGKKRGEGGLPGSVEAPKRGASYCCQGEYDR